MSILHGKSFTKISFQRDPACLDVLIIWHCSLCLNTKLYMICKTVCTVCSMGSHNSLFYVDEIKRYQQQTPNPPAEDNFSLSSQNTLSMLSSYKKYKTCKLLHNRKAQKVWCNSIAPMTDPAFSFFQSGMMTGLYCVLASNPVALSPHFSDS